LAKEDERGAKGCGVRAARRVFARVDSHASSGGGQRPTAVVVDEGDHPRGEVIDEGELAPLRQPMARAST
jgi:hypothetical protein